jgi:hypothetical protein
MPGPAAEHGGKRWGLSRSKGCDAKALAAIEESAKG